MRPEDVLPYLTSYAIMAKRQAYNDIIAKVEQRMCDDCRHANELEHHACIILDELRAEIECLNN